MPASCCPDHEELLDGLFEVAAECAVPGVVDTADPVAFFELPAAANERLERCSPTPSGPLPTGAGSGPSPGYVGGPESGSGAARLHRLLLGVHVGCWAEDLSAGRPDAQGISTTHHPQIAARRPKPRVGSRAR